MSSIGAWLLDWPPQALALARCEVIEVVEQPEVHRVPLGPGWCRALLRWRERFLPLALAADASLEGCSIVVVAWQMAPNAPLEHAAIAVRGTPRQIEVHDGADCDPPQGPLPPEYLRACFRFEDRVVIVPELSALFAAPLAA